MDMHHRDHPPSRIRRSGLADFLARAAGFSAILGLLGFALWGWLSILL